jgi:hypothetical protein
MREIVPSYRFATQIAWEPITIAVGPRPTGIVVITLALVGSTRFTSSSALSVTHTDRRPTAMPVGPRPTLTLAVTAPVPSTRETALSRMSVTQRSPPLLESAAGVFPVWVRSTMAPVFASTWRTIPP